MTAMRRTSPARRQPAPVYPRDAMKGPKRAAAGILIFFAASILAVHLAYEDPAPAVASAAAAEPAPPDASAPAASAPAPSQAAPGAAARVRVAAARAAPPVPTDVPISEPSPSLGGPRDRDLDACVERVVAAFPEARPSAPGRWPAIKRAREELRRRRLAAREDCARELAM